MIDIGIKNYESGESTYTANTHTRLSKHLRFYTSPDQKWLETLFSNLNNKL